MRKTVENVWSCAVPLDLHEREDKAVMQTGTGPDCIKFRIAKKSKLKWVKAKTHKEKVLVKAAYDEPVYEEVDLFFCGKCDWVEDPNSDVSPNEQAAKHQVDMVFTKGENHNICLGGGPTAKVQADTIHHDAVYKTKTVVDRPGYWK